ncbi:ADP-ribosylation factor-binding protein GGA3 [Bicyclus anynana]|uniref:ADP-ribosylation factor-binding protein GGA3 n=1 Tax=Bicyclus anynana TaxID=110368 RepID=A0A6J1N8N5_BICAN|nr:ADP-ribosylation factor-binding protein GGA3 [Bicyclus anynana]
MNVTLTSLEALILKATHESLPQPDAAAVEAFCAVMRDSTEGAQLAAQALAGRIHSLNTREALLALVMLDRCMRRCDANFHAEVGKFRFLNEMIKLVSPKYFADRTSPDVRTRVLQLLHAWSLEYPKETKFKVAFEMLKSQGVVKDTPPPLPPEDNGLNARPRAKNAIFEDEEKSKLLQKLLQSKKPEDLQHANRLIKTMVREEERRSEANSRRAQEVSAALDSAGLLRDMLAHAQDASTDEEQLIHELHSSCARQRPVLQRLASSDAHADNLSDILHANDVLDDVFEKYNKFVMEKRLKPKEPQREGRGSNSLSLLDFAGASAHRDEGEMPKSRSSQAIDELGDIFSNDGNTNAIAQLLKPVNLMTIDDAELLEEKDKKVEGWNELDSLGAKLLKESLPDNARRVDHFNNKHTKKIPMNALEKPSPKHDALANTALLDLDFFTKKPEEKLSPAAHSTKSITLNDDVMVDISSDDKSTTNNLNDNLNLHTESRLDNILDIGVPLEQNANAETLVDNKSNESEERIKTKVDVKPLTDINVTLQSVHPSKVPPLTAFEEQDGLTVVLHFCKDKPRPDVNVIVVSTTSRNSSAIEDYKFQAVVPKGYRVRLLSASGSSLPPYNPFLPPPALTQLLLLGAPPAAPPPALRFVLTYSCDDDACTEMGEVASLPLEHI